MGNTGLPRMELEFAELLWENAPVASGYMVKLAGEKFGWKKSTVYTVLKKLCEKGYFINKSGTVFALIPKKEYYHILAVSFIDEYFGGSLAGFIASCRNGKPIEREDVIEWYGAVKNY